MRLLTAILGTVLVLSVALVPAVPPTPVEPAAAHPPRSPEHGIDPSTFWVLWAGDDDQFVSDRVFRNRTGRSRSGVRALANGTDVPFLSPPAAVERWNRRDLRSFPDTNRSVSVHPPFADLRNDRFVADAYAAVFAVQASTRAHYEPARSPLLVDDTGRVLGTIDYRVTRPANDTSGDRQVRWTLRDHGIRETRLLVDGEVQQRKPGSHTPRLAFDSLPGAGTHVLTLAATIRVRFTREVRRCRQRRNGTCTAWNVTHELVSERVVVDHSIRVSEYDLSITGKVARFPDGDVGVAVTATAPWTGLIGPRGAIRTRWRFYSVRDERWDRLVWSSANGSDSEHSPVHPLVVHAYPGRSPVAADPGAGRVRDVAGTRRTPPSLPSAIDVDVATGRYRVTEILRARIAGAGDAGAVRYRGLVRGSGGTLAGSVEVVPVHRTNLSVTVLSTSAETVTVAVRLRDATAGEGIATTTGEGTIIVNGERVATGANGTAYATVPRSRLRGGVRASYEPGPWWRGDVAHQPATDLAYAGGGIPELLAVTAQYVAAASLLLFGVALLDRLVPGRLWPPWRGV